MKTINVYLYSAMFLFSLLITTVVAYAADAPDLGASVTGLIDAIKIGQIGVILVASVQLLKTDFFGSLLAKVNPKIIPWVTLALAIIGNVGVGLMQPVAKPIWVLIIEGVLGAFASNGIYEMFKIPQAKS